MSRERKARRASKTRLRRTPLALIDFVLKPAGIAGKDDICLDDSRGFAIGYVGSFSCMRRSSRATAGDAPSGENRMNRRLQRPMESASA